MKNLFLLFSGLVIWCLLGFSNEAFGQYTPVKIFADNTIESDFKDKLTYNAVDSTDAREYLNNFRIELISEGYLTASFDNITWRKDSILAPLFLGQKFKWAALKPGNIPEEYLSKAKFREKLYRNEDLKPVHVSLLFERLISHAENNGFPFASVKLDSVITKNETVSAVLNMERNNFTILDSVIIKGSINTNRKYIENYIGYKKGIPYNQDLLNAIPNRLKEIPFAKIIKPYEIGLRPGKTDIYVYLDHKKASHFDGIIGIQPDDNTGKTVITGDVKLNLLNALKQGETINLRWQRLATNTQELNLAFAYPFILNTPIGVSFEFDLYRQDTIYSQLRSQVGLQYFIKGGNYAKVYYENIQANVISNNQTQLTDLVDSRINMFGVGLEFKDLDYKFNPTKGFFVSTDIGFGEKKILKNPDIDDAQYDDIELDTDIYNLNLNAGNYFPIGKRSTILVRVKGGYFVNENMFRNEMYRIGGLKTLRGFDEQSILASAYAVATLEYRFILEQNSNLFLFVDQGAYEDAGRDETISDTPMGFGGGISFETKPGVFSLTYALGKQFDNSIEIKSGKIHFGFISFF